MRTRWWLIATVLVAIIVAGAIFWQSVPKSPAGQPVPEPRASRSPEASVDAAMAGDLTITITPQEVENARFKIEEVSAGAGVQLGGGLRTTGTIQSNSYKDVPVFPVAGGIIRDISVVSGDRVARGQRLATVFSTELSEAQTTFLNMQVEIEKHHLHYSRTVRLAEIGAVSREELETVQAEYKTEQARLSAARERLLYLGMKPSQVDSLKSVDQMSAIVPVESPAGGVLLSRSVNNGEVVSLGKELFRVTDLSTVWVIAQVYESDFLAVPVGTSATITSGAFGGRSFQGRVSYVDPRVEPQTRTAQVRIETQNASGLLKLGMFVDVTFATKGRGAGVSNATTVSQSAVQQIGSTKVVYLATPRAGVFTQRVVQALEPSEGRVAIVEGLSSGDRVVSEGSFLLRSESLKLHPSQLSSSSQHK